MSFFGSTFDEYIQVRITQLWTIRNEEQFTIVIILSISGIMEKKKCNCQGNYR